MTEKWTMSLATAVQILADFAGRYGENAEEEYARRIKEDDSLEDLKTLLDPDQTIDGAVEIRDLWRVIEVVRRDFNKTVEGTPR